MRTNDQKIYLPNPLPDGMAVGANYRLFPFHGRGWLSILRDHGWPLLQPSMPGVDDDTSQSPYLVNVKRFTLNVALAQQDAAIDILQSKLLPSFRGYTKQNKLGQIQICVEKPSPIRDGVTGGRRGRGGIHNVRQIRRDSSIRTGTCWILGTFTVNAEMATVSGTTGSAVLPLTAVTTKPPRDQAKNC